jgi:hypothetical protein
MIDERQGSEVRLAPDPKRGCKGHGITNASMMLQGIDICSGSGPSGLQITLQITSVHLPRDVSSFTHTQQAHVDMAVFCANSKDHLMGMKDEALQGRSRRYTVLSVAALGEIRMSSAVAEL